ncbi:hypothetical protein C8R27_12933 [Nitrosomonas ureae]|nr:hypothetical protein [Nitrosomonas ureae]PXX11419.1 hypothetical protein C8R27_12933 [Nitrosomonas ureae]
MLTIDIVEITVLDYNRYLDPYVWLQKATKFDIGRALKIKPTLQIGLANY